jgi:hypothetical protein
LFAASYLSFDIMADVTFSVKRHLIEKPEYRWITECIEKMMNRIGVISVSLDPYPQSHSCIFQRNSMILRAILTWNPQMIPWTRWWGIGLHWLLVPGGVLAFVKFMGEVEYFIKTRLSIVPSEGKRDVYQNLLNAKDPETGEELGQPELLAEAGVLIVAVCLA